MSVWEFLKPWDRSRVTILGDLSSDLISSSEDSCIVLFPIAGKWLICYYYKDIGFISVLENMLCLIEFFDELIWIYSFWLSDSLKSF